MATTMSNMFNSTEAGAYLGLDSSMVRRYCIEGRIRAEKIGNNWVMTKKELDRFASIERRAGNPNFGK